MHPLLGRGGGADGDTHGDSDRFSRLLAYAGKGTLRRESTDISALVTEMGQLLETAVGRRGTIALGCDPNVPTIGASGAIFGLIAAYGIIFGERRILFMLIFPMKARTFAIILGAMALFNTVNQPGSGVSDVAHLGGAVTGFLYLKRVWRPGRLLSELRWKLRRRRFKVMDRRDDDYPFH